MDMLYFGIFLVLILSTMPGYLLSTLSVFGKLPSIGRIYFGFTIGMGIFAIGGVIISYLKIFSPIFVFAFVILYNIFSVLIYVYIKDKYNTKYIYNDIRHLFEIKTSYMCVILVLLFLLTFLINMSYSQQSLFPIGYDRGNHFGNSIYLINRHTLPLTEPGTQYNIFYFQGQNLIISTIVGSTMTVLGQDIDPTNFDSLVYISRIFNIYFGLIISIGTFFVYLISFHIYKNINITVLSSLIFVLISGLGFVMTGSIGVVIGFMFLSIFFVYIDIMTTSNLNYLDYIFFVIIIIAIISTHIIAVVYMSMLFVLFIIWRILKKDFDIKKIKIPLILITIGFLSYLFLYSYFYPQLLNGIADEIIRKKSIDTGIDAPYEKYFNDNFDEVFDDGILFMLPLFIYGFLYDVKIFRSSSIIPFLFTSLLFTFAKILPFVKPWNYLVYPISIIGGVGIYYMLHIVRRRIMIYLLILIVLGIAQSTTGSYDYATKRLYNDYETYKVSHGLSTWLDAELNSSQIIVFPGSDGSAYLMNAISRNKIMFAEPRWIDNPSSVDISKLYTEYPTNVALFDYRNVSTRERYDIIEKYNISVIIATNRIKPDVEQLELYYPKIKIYDYKTSYQIIILGDKNDKRY